MMDKVLFRPSRKMVSIFMFSLCIVGSLSLSINFDSNVKGLEVKVNSARNGSTPETPEDSGNHLETRNFDNAGEGPSLQKFFEYLGRKHKALVSLHPLFSFPNRTLAPIKTIPQLVDETVERFQTVYGPPKSQSEMESNAIELIKKEPEKTKKAKREISQRSDSTVCATRSELKQHEANEEDEINAIKEELKKLKDLIIILRDQQHVLDLLNDIQKTKVLQNDINPSLQHDQNNKDNGRLLKLLQSLNMQINSEPITVRKVASNAFPVDENGKVIEAGTVESIIKPSQEIKALVENLRYIEGRLLKLAENNQKLTQEVITKPTTTFPIERKPENITTTTPPPALSTEKHENEMHNSEELQKIQSARLLERINEIKNKLETLSSSVQTKARNNLDVKHDLDDLIARNLKEDIALSENSTNLEQLATTMKLLDDLQDKINHQEGKSNARSNDDISSDFPEFLAKNLNSERDSENDDFTRLIINEALQNLGNDDQNEVNNQMDDTFRGFNTPQQQDNNQESPSGPNQQRLRSLSPLTQPNCNDYRLFSDIENPEYIKSLCKNVHSDYSAPPPPPPPHTYNNYGSYRPFHLPPPPQIPNKDESPYARPPQQNQAFNDYRPYQEVDYRQLPPPQLPPQYQPNKDYVPPQYQPSKDYSPPQLPPQYPANKESQNNQPFLDDSPPNRADPYTRNIKPIEEWQKNSLEGDLQQQRFNSFNNPEAEDKLNTDDMGEQQNLMNEREEVEGKLPAEQAQIFRRKRDLREENISEREANEFVNKIYNMLGNDELPEGNDMRKESVLSQMPIDNTIEFEKRKLRSQIDNLKDEIETEAQPKISSEQPNSSGPGESNEKENEMARTASHHSPHALRTAPMGYYHGAHPRQYGPGYGSQKGPVYSKHSDLLTSIIEKIFEKLKDIIPVLLKGLVGDFIDGAFYDQGYSGYGTGYGAQSYNNNGYEIRDKFRSFGLLGVLPLALLNILSTVSYFFRLLQKNKFIRNFLVPVGVIIGVTGLVAFLVFWFNYDAFAGNYNDYNNYQKIGYEAPNYGPSNSYKKPYYRQSNNGPIPPPFNLNQERPPFEQPPNMPRPVTRVIDRPNPNLFGKV